MGLRRSWVWASWPLVLAGCDVVGVVDCPAYVPPAVIVEVTDSLSGAWAADGAQGYARKSGMDLPLEVYAYEVVDGVAVATSLAPEGGPAGVYEVEITLAGYTTWTRGGIVVTEGVCGVETVALTARLQPEPPPEI